MYLKSLKKIIFLLFLFAPSQSFAVMDSEEAAAFAGFIQDLVHTTQTKKQSGALCSSGSDEISKIMAQEKNFIDLDRQPARFTSCKAIYIALGKQKGFMTDVAKFNKNKILTVAVFDGFTESGGMVQVQIGRRNFELTLNSKAMKEASVRLNALAMSLVIN